MGLNQELARNGIRKEHRFHIQLSARADHTATELNIYEKLKRNAWGGAGVIYARIVTQLRNSGIDRVKLTANGDNLPVFAPIVRYRVLGSPRARFKLNGRRIPPNQISHLPTFEDRLVRDRHARTVTAGRSSAAVKFVSVHPGWE